MSKLILSLFMTLSLAHNAYAINACVAEKPNASLKDLLKVVKELKPNEREISKEFCWAQNVCEEGLEYDDMGNSLQQFSSKPMPQDFKCPGYIDQEMSLKFNCGMTAEERLALSDYSAAAYDCMNTYLRMKGKPNKSMDFYIQTLNNALDKLPNYEGIVVRGADLPQEIADQHKIGATVTYEAFTSTSTAEGFYEKDYFVIFSKTGKPIMGLSTIQDEYEVLFKSGTKFKVLDVVKHDEMNIYFMKEMTCGPGSAQEKKEDEGLIKKIKDGKVTLNDSWDPDEWNCSEEKGDVPLKVKQKSLPRLQFEYEDYPDDE